MIASYVFTIACDLLQEEDVDGVHLGQVCLALLSEEVVHISLGFNFLHEFMHVDLSELMFLVLGIQ